jgi:hypothetical protein
MIDFHFVEFANVTLVYVAVLVKLTLALLLHLLQVDAQIAAALRPW